MHAHSVISLFTKFVGSSNRGGGWGSAPKRDPLWIRPYSKPLLNSSTNLMVSVWFSQPSRQEQTIYSTILCRRLYFLVDTPINSDQGPHTRPCSHFPLIHPSTVHISIIAHVLRAPPLRDVMHYVTQTDACACSLCHLESSALKWCYLRKSKEIV